MRILWVATKTPWPPVDGGRLVSALTLEALRDAGHEITLVAPIDPDDRGGAEVEAGLRAWCRPFLVPARPASLLWGGLRSALGRTPVTIRRHALRGVRDRVSCLVAEEPFDLVHAEQMQALAQCEGTRLPVVLRAQNVESDLWSGTAGRAGVLAFFLRREAHRLAAWEGRAVHRTAATVALTARDAALLARLSADEHKVFVVPAPFPARLPPGDEPLPGRPAVVLFGSAGWRPNQEGTAWFQERVWPEVRAACPQAILHVFGGAAAPHDGVVGRPALSDSRQAFPEGSILVVPLHVASGVRMKVLEAWARGVPVVATPQAAAGLEAAHGRELLLAADVSEFASAIRRLRDEPGLAGALVKAGRKLLEARHAPSVTAWRLGEVYSGAQRS